MQNQFIGPIIPANTLWCDYCDNAYNEEGSALCSEHVARLAYLNSIGYSLK